MDLENQYLNMDYIEAISEGISVSKYITHLNLRNTNLNTAGAMLIVKSMMVKKIKHLDMGYNPALSEEFYQTIADVIYDETCSLEFVSFESNLMGNKNVAILSESIMHNVRLRVLNLSKNEITDKSSSRIC